MPFDADALSSRFLRAVPAGAQVALRVVDETSDRVTVRQNVAQPAHSAVDRGAMVTAIDGDGIGYAATSDLSDGGLRDAVTRALEWARLARGRSVFDGTPPRLGSARARYASPTVRPVTLSKADRIALLMQESQQAKAADTAGHVVDWEAALWTVHTETLHVAPDGSVAHGQYDFIIPSLHVTASRDGVTQTRSWGGRYNGLCQQGGLEVLDRSGFYGSGHATAQDALALLAAPNCPNGKFDVVLMPDQMMLQIHESIGHPLELDRILGDERNYAGTSFVTLDMFGHYRYGSALLNVTFDPTRGEEFASFACDDEGTPAAREFLIRDGVLLRPLGGASSVQRARAEREDIEGVATTRACSWSRPPIDRMSNLNIEPGTTTLEQMIGSIETGVLMKTTRSWSIDDSRNKFQFGCEWGQMIRNGQLAEVVRDPNYRGVSSTFWRSLAMVGDTSTVEVSGTPYCGKGEPNQAIRVGHASPACKFADIDVFGAER